MVAIDPSLDNQLKKVLYNMYNAVDQGLEYRKKGYKTISNGCRILKTQHGLIFANFVNEVENILDFDEISYQEKFDRIRALIESASKIIFKKPILELLR